MKLAKIVGILGLSTFGLCHAATADVTVSAMNPVPEIPTQASIYTADPVEDVQLPPSSSGWGVERTRGSYYYQSDNDGAERKGIRRHGFTTTINSLNSSEVGVQQPARDVKQWSLPVVEGDGPYVDEQGY